ncbi:recombinase family protein [Deinococcus wulumuqiensis]|uniref:Resolvase/invertase-type recombinase catalytic domain-containing protein n=1 Tax=Deinococcus wulumuqiensis TaxID=980427 RepID=A0AAV4K5F1_9DEIO|nr:recombinase family protein [Deinococcus wulumuqiensis]QII20000.1 recombinase family protein [Deinococcus wulumuqiensis R12]GGI86823.1 hypothetical protein GCM10010914_21610 [Deinococcus wulumuqiensis]GGP29934.1 hypothetical protein GCM10008021_15850 [Deinococcus wulumuqiensis]
MTVRAYIRVSGRHQVDGFSLGAQQAKCQAWATYQGLGDVVVYEDAGLSGRGDNRPGLQALLLDLVPGDVVVILSITRLARGGAVQLLTLVNSIREKGARLVFLSENIDTDNYTGRLMLTTFAGFAEMEVEQTRDRAMMGKTQAAQQGLYPHNPHNLRMGWATDEEGRIVEDEHAETVRRIIRQGRASYRQTADLLNREGVPTRNGLIGRWDVYQVQRIVTHAGYWTGEVIFRESSGGEQIVIPAPPLVSREEWEAAQRPRSANSVFRRPDLYPLTGHLSCACGHGLAGQRKDSQRGRKRFYEYYFCSPLRRGTATCPAWQKRSPCFPVAPLHQHARHVLAEAVANPTDPLKLALAWQGELPPDPHAKERADIAQRLDALLDLYLDNMVDRAIYAQRRQTFERRLEELAPPAPVAPVAMPARPDLAAAILASTNEEFAALLDLLEVRFVQCERDRVELQSYTPLG